jgi:PAS domain-containing protein
LVIAVAVFVGYHIDAERLERANADRARNEQQAVEARYRQLFDTNTAPILVADSSGTILDANPAARALIPGNLPGRFVHDILGVNAEALDDAVGHVIAISVAETGLGDYRVSAAHVRATSAKEPLTQLVLEDVTQERAEGRRVHRFAGLRGGQGNEFLATSRKGKARSGFTTRAAAELTSELAVMSPSATANSSSRTAQIRQGVGHTVPRHGDCHRG